MRSRNLLADKLEELSPAAKTRMNTKKKRSMEVHMSRKKKQVDLDEPLAFDEISPELLSRVLDGNGEAIFQEKLNYPSQMAIFATASNLEILGECRIWALDATFKAVPMPHVFKQSLVIAGYHKGRFFTLAYILMTKRKTEDYARVLEFLPLSDRVKLILSDFEKALINALKARIEELELEILVGFFLLPLFEALFLAQRLSLSLFPGPSQAIQEDGYIAGILVAWAGL